MSSYIIDNDINYMMRSTYKAPLETINERWPISYRVRLV